MPESDRLGESIEWIDLEFVERERTPEFAMQEGIHLHLAGVSLSNTKHHLDTLGVEWSRTVIHNGVQKATLQPDSEGLYSYYQATLLGEGILEHDVRELMCEEWDLLDAYSD